MLYIIIHMLCMLTVPFAICWFDLHVLNAVAKAHLLFGVFPLLQLLGNITIY